jgi:LysM repeat protein
MPYKKYVLVIAIAAVMLSSCKMSYPGSSATAIPTKPFTNPLPTGSDPMKDLENFATATALAAMAKTATAGGATLAPMTATPTVGPGGVVVPTSTNTPAVGIIPSNTPGIGGAGGGTITPTIAVQVGRPAQYTLQQGEFVFCLARRFNVDPNDILSLNGLFDSETVYPGAVLKIPQSGSFPGERALRAHPGTYTVTGNNDTTIYGVACAFGDVDPAAIAQRNSLSLSAILTIGQVLNIP